MIHEIRFYSEISDGKWLIHPDDPSVPTEIIRKEKAQVHFDELDRRFRNIDRNVRMNIFQKPEVVAVGRGKSAPHQTPAFPSGTAP